MWERHHAWILQAVARSGPRGTLRSVISNADAINMTVPTREELERAVQRLQAAGLVKTYGTIPRATRAGRRIVRESRPGWGESIGSVTARVESLLLEQVPYPARPSDWALSPDEWEAACNDYRGGSAP
ncbi:MAG: hypothetical protein ACJ762_21180 [Solirubrobacteraceae bacterium]